MQPGAMTSATRQIGARALGFALLVGAACVPAVQSAAKAPLSGAQRDEWAQLTWEKRHDEMTWLVLPNMARLFQRIRGTQYPEMTCRACHGADAEAIGYQMPRRLPALNPNRMPDPNENSPRGRMAKVMAQEVTPQMAQLLGKSVYDPATKRGFGCFQCHPVQR